MPYVVKLIIMVWHYGNLIKHLVLRDIKLKYRYSAIGLLWSLLNPVLMIAVYTFAFGYILKSPVSNYAVFLLTGMLPWTFFSGSLLTATTAILDNGTLIKKLRFPLETLPLSIVIFQLFLLIMSLLALLPAAFAVFGLRPTMGTGAFLLLLPLQILMTAGLALLLSTATVYFRDVRHLTEVALMLMFWLTPVVYDAHALPRAVADVLLYLNPMASFTIGYQDALLLGKCPSAKVLAIAAFYSMAALAAGTAVFARHKNHFAEEI